MDKDITNQRFGLLTAIEPTEKRQGSDVVWRFRCDCGRIVERTKKHLSENSGCEVCKPKGFSLRKDYTGQRFGSLTALEPTGRHKGKALTWLLKCDCGNIVELPVSSFTGGNTKSCGCKRHSFSRESNPNYENLIGRQFGILVVEALSEARSRDGKALWICRCRCGNTVIASTKQLKEGLKRSCGCTNMDLFCVFKHVSPDGRVYVGTTKRIPQIAWFTGSRYEKQTAMKTAIENAGGFDSFRNTFKHYYYTQDNCWIEWTGGTTYNETNVYPGQDAEKLRREFIKEYKSNLPEYGFNATTGGKKDFKYTDEAKDRMSDTHTGRGGSNDWHVYMHTCRINQKRYIGITCQDPLARWSAGKGYILNQETQNNNTGHFYNAIKKYGWDSFDHEVLYSGLTKEEANKIEKELILKYDTRNPEKGYNITAGGDGAEGAKHSKETRERISRLAKERIRVTGEIPFKGKKHTEKTKAVLSRKARERYAINGGTFAGKQHTEETKKKLSEKHSKAVNQYNMSGEFIIQYPSASAAAAATGVSIAALSDAAKGKTRFCADSIWKYAKDAPPKGESIDAAAILGNSRHYGQKKAVDQLSLDGIFIHRYDSIKNAAEAIGAGVSNISASAWGRTKSCCGYKWRFSEPDMLDSVINPNEK